MIRNIKWNHHEVLGDLELDFTKSDGTPYNTIVLAGENGVGKTTIIYSTDYHIELYSYLQSKAQAQSIKACDEYIEQQAGIYDRTKHERPSSFTNNSGHTTHYNTLPTFVRNAIDHPNTAMSYTQQDLEISTNLLIDLCRLGELH